MPIAIERRNLMKAFITNVALFVVFCIVFSGLTGCNGSQVTNENLAKAPANANSNAPANKTNAYPPLPSGLANIDMEMLDGTKSKVSDHKGKYLILNLWGIWCGPCRDEMPHLAALPSFSPFRDNPITRHRKASARAQSTLFRW